MAEQRALGAFLSAPITFVLTSIAWREAWKYRDRAYRYCLHDMGHAWQSLALAAHAMGCRSFAAAHFPDDETAQQCRLHHDEWPMLLVTIESGPLSEPDAHEPLWYGGRANPLSVEQVPYPRIEDIHEATKISGHSTIKSCEPASGGRGEIHLPPPASMMSFGEVARVRRSALDFVGGTRSISLAQLSALLTVTAQPLHADFAEIRFVQLYLYVHRVDGLEAGVYRHWPATAELELVRSGDQQVAAAGLSLGQDLAGNCCVAFSMIADLDRATRCHGGRGYRYAHFEAGAIGQRLYLAAEALGLRATGIGAFFDDEVHSYLDLSPAQGQVIYHFAVGYAGFDPRVEA